MEFESPLAFLLLLLIPVVLEWRRSQNRRLTSAMIFSGLASIRQAGESLRHHLLFLPLLLRILCLLCLITALARPRQGTEELQQTSEGIAIEMVVDRSGSMAQPMRFGTEVLNRLEVVKRVFAEFVTGNDAGLTGRPNDLIGLVTYGTYADTICPLTLARDPLLAFLEKIKLPPPLSTEGKTAIGDAVALAAARLQKAEEVALRQSDQSPGSYRIKSKIIILLTDGEHNAGRRTPQEAASLAKKWGIKIHVIGIDKPFFQSREGRNALSTMKTIAEETGGLFAVGDDEESLREIYRQIDQMETSEISSHRYVNYRECFPLLLAAALTFLLLEILLQGTLFRRIP